MTIGEVITARNKYLETHFDKPTMARVSESDFNSLCYHIADFMRRNFEVINPAEPPEAGLKIAGLNLVADPEITKRIIIE